jgi:hypothetical protein
LTGIEIFVPLMVAAIESAGQVLSATVSKFKEAANKHVFTKEFVENVISDSNEQLGNLLTAISSDIKQEIREQSILDSIQELQADITVLGKLLDLANASELTPAFAERLIPNALIPLQKDLEKAQSRLKHYGRDDISLYCHIVGTKTLIAGYSYLGQTVPSLHKELEVSAQIFQKQLLDEIAQMAVKTNQQISWEKIPHLLTIEGVSDLYILYDSVAQNKFTKKTKTTNGTAIKPEKNITVALPTNGALSRFIKIANQQTLKKSAEVYLQNGIELLEKSEFDDAILEFVKVFRKSSPPDKVYQSAKEQLRTMGFTDEDMQLR